MSVKGKIVALTGASSGIGFATARLLLDQGAKVAMSARHVDSLGDFEKNHPDDVLIMKVDVRDHKQVKSFIDQTVEKFGGIDVLFNNAGIMPVSKLIEDRRSDWQDMIDVNITGVLNGISSVLPVMEKQGHGHIIATDSTAGFKVFPSFAVYSATKFAVKALMEGVRQEEQQKNIKTTLIYPGTTATDLYKTIPDQKAREAEHSLQHGDRVLQAEDIAKMVVFAIDTPDHVSLNELNVRPTLQEP